MSVARFIADQRTLHRVPHAVCCALLQHPTTAQRAAMLAPAEFEKITADQPAAA